MKLLSRNFQLALVTLAASAVVGGAQSSWAQTCDPNIERAIKNEVENTAKRIDDQIKTLQREIEQVDLELTRIGSKSEYSADVKRRSEEIQSQLERFKEAGRNAIFERDKHMIALRISDLEEEYRDVRNSAQASWPKAETEQALSRRKMLQNSIDGLVKANNNLVDSARKSILNAANKGNLADCAILFRSKQLRDVVDGKGGHNLDDVASAIAKEAQRPVAQPSWWRSFRSNELDSEDFRRRVRDWSDGLQQSPNHRGRLGQVCSMALALAGVVGNFFSGSTAEACEPTKPNPLAPMATPTVSGSPSPGAGSSNGDSFDNTGGSSNDSPEADLPACPICPSPNPEPTPTVAAVPSPIGTRAATQRSR